MTNSQRNILILVLLLAIAWLLVRRSGTPPLPDDASRHRNGEVKKPAGKPVNEEYRNSSNIDALTAEAAVVPYVKANGKLPPFYITKAAARAQGWDAGKGNLCDVLPGRAIGGDVFTNRQKLLPEKAGRKWFEADLNYDCGRRNAHRLLYSSDGLVFVTHDHYKTVQQQ